MRSPRGVSRFDATQRTLDVVHTFAGGGLDRAAHLREDDATMRRLLEAPGTRVLPFHDLRPLLRGTEALEPAWQPVERLRDRLEAGADLVFLGLDDGQGRFAIADSDDRQANPSPDPEAFVAVRAAAPMLGGPDAAAVALARSLLAWNAAHRYCPSCGSPTESSQAGHQRRCRATECGTVQFPRTDPVVIIV